MMSRGLGWLLAALLTLAPGRAVDHGPFDRLLAAHVTAGRVDYPAFAAAGDFKSYLAALAAAEPASLPDDRARLALYLNAYNAFVIDGVCARWPLVSVIKVAGFFDRETHELGGQALTLDRLENELIRPVGDPRVHFALTAGALGGPPLRSEAYTAERLEAQLEAQTSLFVNDTARVRLDREGKVVYLSRLFQWYKPDFEAAGGPAGFLRRYLTDESDRAWLGEGGYRLEYQPFDWALNKL